jgi:hypothetical protein
MMPTPGTTTSQRRQQLDIMSFMDVRVLGTQVYKGPDGNYILSLAEVAAGHDREAIKQRILDFEIANSLVVQDQPTQQFTQPQGAPQMTQPFQPPNGAPPQQPMPPQQYAPPQFQQPQFAMPPQAPPPPVASPQQAAAVGGPPEAPAEGGKKRGRGPGKAAAGAAAPPPPPPPAPQGMQGGYQPPQQFQPPAQQFAQPAPFQQAPPQAPQGFTPPQFAAQPQPATFQAPPPQQQVPQAAPAPQQDLVGEIRAVGQAVAANAQANLNLVTELRKEVEGLKNLNLSLVAALHHLYITSPQLAGSVQGKDVGDAAKFLAYLAAYLPK